MSRNADTAQATRTAQATQDKADNTKQNTNMSNTQNTTPTPAVVKFPRSFWISDAEGEDIKLETSEAIKMIAKKLKLKPIKVGDFTVEPNDIVKNFITAHLHGEAIPEDLADNKSLEIAFDKIGEYVADHLETQKKKKDDEEEEKKLKKLAKEQSEAEKVAEAKKLQEMKDKFELAFTKKYEKAEEAGINAASSIGSKIALPKNITLSTNGMGLVVADNASLEDLASAATSVLGALVGIQGQEAKVQFLTGDLMNRMVFRKFYRTADEAAKGIKLVMTEKLGKTYDPGTIKQFATMAGRVPAEHRLSGVKPSYYLRAVNNLNAPKLGAGATKEQIAEEAKIWEEKRMEVVDAINRGELTSIKQIDAAITEFKKSKGIAKKASTKADIEVALRKFFLAHWVKKNLVKDRPDITVEVNEGEALPVTRCAYLEAGKGALMLYSNEYLDSEICENWALLEKLLIENAEAVIAGEITVKDKKVPCYMKDPFMAEPETKATAETSDMQEMSNVKEDGESEDEDEDEDEVEDEDEDEDSDV